MAIHVVWGDRPDESKLFLGRGCLLAAKSFVRSLPAGSVRPEWGDSVEAFKCDASAEATYGYYEISNGWEFVEMDG